MKKVKYFEDACKVLLLDPKKVIPDFSAYPKEDQASMIAHAKLVIIVKAVNKIANKGKIWKPDFDNANEYKYEIWWYKEERGSSGFQFDVFGNWLSLSNVGSRLCFISLEVAKENAEQFKDLWNEYLL